MRQLRECGEVKQSEKCPNFVLEQVQQLYGGEDYRQSNVSVLFAS